MCFDRSLARYRVQCSKPLTLASKYKVNLNDSSGFETLCIERYTTYKDERYMTRYIHSPSLKPNLVARVLSRWQACSGTVQDGGNAGKSFCVLEYAKCSSVTSVQRAFLRKSCTWSFVVCTRNLTEGDEAMPFNHKEWECPLEQCRLTSSETSSAAEVV
ncbi:hypothetical protein AVEN_251789-1 [Araneus ventricosus]|uniref:Uncharacterized protein n=1 Tax=Araneus ventricosus TaxID=182803 RepID=A0A4Y2DZP2_ARAVE|nr:hypothetical protein AVEN_251789-1 [Araneus ventricosus]